MEAFAVFSVFAPFIGFIIGVIVFILFIGIFVRHGYIRNVLQNIESLLEEAISKDEKDHPEERKN